MGFPFNWFIIIRCPQWGDDSMSSTQTTVTFPIAFTRSFQMFANDIGAGSHPLGATSSTTTGIVYCKDNTPVTFRYFVIGLT